MSRRRNAGIQHNLSAAFLPWGRAGMPSAGEEDADQPGDPPSPADDATDDDADEHEDETPVDSKGRPILDSKGRPIIDPVKQQLSQEAGANRVRAKQEKARADAAEATVAELRQHNAFLLAAAGKVTDLEAAWKLADRALLVADAEGIVQGGTDVVAALTERYPYLLPEPEVPYVPPAIGTSGQPMNSGRRGKPDPNVATRQQLERRFPALKVKR